MSSSSSSPDPDPSSYLSSSSVYISELDRRLFLVLFLQFGLPALITGGVAIIIAYRIRFKPSLLPALLSASALLSPPQFERWIFWIVICVGVVLLTPFVFIGAWAATVYRDVSPLFGITLLLVGYAALILIYGFAHWRNNRWRIDLSVRISFLVCAVLVGIFELWAVFLAHPFTYLGVSAVFIAFNMIPMAVITYLTADGATKSLESYERLDFESWANPYSNNNKNNNNNNAPAPAPAPALAPAPAPPLQPNDIHIDMEQDEKHSASSPTPVPAGLASGSRPGQPPHPHAVHAEDAHFRARGSSSDSVLGPAPTSGSGSGSASLSARMSMLSREKVISKSIRLLLYLLSLVILVLYGFIVLWLDDLGTSSVGFVTVAAVIILDVTVFLCVYGGKIVSPLRTCLYQLGCRVALVVFGDRYWFVGHSIMYFILASFFGWNLLDQLIPHTTETHQKAQAVAELAAAVPSLRGSQYDLHALAARDRLRDNFIRRGRLFHSTWGQFVFRYVSLVALSLLTVTFTIDLIVTRFANVPDIQLQHTHKQYLTGIVSMFCVVVFVLSLLLHRVYGNAGSVVTVRVLWVAVLNYVIILCGGIFLFTGTRSVVIISLCAFMPPIVYLAYWGYAQWVKQDYQVLQDYRPQNRPHRLGRGIGTGTGGMAAAGAGLTANDPGQSPGHAFGDLEMSEWKQASSDVVPLPISIVDPESGSVFVGIDRTIAAVVDKYPRLKPVRDWLTTYALIVCEALVFILAGGLGLTISVNSSPALVGYTMTTAIVLISCTLIPIIEWFNSFELSRNIVVHLVLSVVVLVSYCVVVFVSHFHRSTDLNSLGVLLALFMYPTVVLLVVAVWKYRDDKWIITGFVKYSFAVCCVLASTFFIITAVVYSPWEVGASVQVAFLVLLLLGWLLPVLRRRSPLAVNALLSFVVAVLVVFAGVVASKPGHGFEGFTVAWGLLFLGLCVLAYLSHRRKPGNNSIQFLYAPDIFPVYEYCSTPGLKNPLRSNNTRVYLIFALLAVAASWGVLAVFFVPQLWIGVGIVSMSLVLLIIYVLDSMNESRVLLADAMHYLEEGSQQYIQVVEKAKLTALRAQLLTFKSVTFDDFSQQMLPHKTFTGGHGSDLSHKELEPGTPQGFSSLDNVDSVLGDHDRKLLGIEDLERGLSAIDWRTCEDMSHKLRASLPAMTYKACCANPDELSTRISWFGSVLTRQQVLALLVKLDHQVALLYHNKSKFRTQLQFEIILSVESLRYEHETAIMTMLRDTGNESFSPQYLHSLPANSPIRKQLELQLDAYLRQQEQIRESNRLRREEELVQTRRREEEELQRQRVIQQQQQVASHGQIARATQQQLAQQLQQQQEQQRWEQEQLRLLQEQEQRLIAEREAREVLEAERLRAEQRAHDEEARRAAEQERIRLQLLKQQQEADRARVLAEAAALREAREREAAAGAAQVATAVQQRVCTLIHTGCNFVVQPWFECYTCNLTDGHGCCQVCRDRCHAGHNVVAQAPCLFYCDCSASPSPSGRCCIATPAPVGASRGGPSEPQTVDEVEAHYRATGQKYVDRSFQAGPKALVRDPNKPKRAQWLKYDWKRPEDLQIQDPKVFVPPVDPQHIRQGAIGDCWFMSAISVLTLRPTQFESVFVTKQHNEYGCYQVRFFKNGEQVNVIVDSYFPATQQGSLAFGRSHEQNELWVAILEKAYAKLHHSYEAIESGFVDQALVDLSGGVGSRVDMTKDEVKAQIRNGTLWSRIEQYYRAGYLMGAGTPAGSDSEANASPSGIIQGHAYAVLQVTEFDGNQLLQLRNPWGRKEWNGDWSDHSDKWTRRAKAKLQYRDADDGTFWMSFVDFTHHFEDIYVCRFFDQQAGWHTNPTIKGEWDQRTAGGCTNFESVKYNPQYLLHVTRVNTQVVICLSQQDNRGTAEKLKAIAIELYRNDGERVTRRKSGELIATNPESYIFRREVTLEVSLSPSPVPYTLLLSTFNEKEFCKFTCQIYSTAPIHQELAPGPGGPGPQGDT